MRNCIASEHLEDQAAKIRILGNIYSCVLKALGEHRGSDHGSESVSFPHDKDMAATPGSRCESGCVGSTDAATAATTPADDRHPDERSRYPCQPGPAVYNGDRSCGTAGSQLGQSGKFESSPSG